MATHQITIAKASKNDFEKVYNLLSPMEELFNNRWSNEESWTEWDDDNEDKLELLAIRKEIAEEEYCDEDEVDNRLVLYEFIKRRMRLCGCSNWQRVVTAAECLIDIFCDPQESCLAWRPDLKRAMSVHPVDLNPKGEWIEVLDNNFFANPRWKEAIDYLIKAGQMVNFHGVDVRIMNEEQAFYLSKLKLKRRIHIAWDLPDIDLTEKLKEVTKYIKPRNLSCYVLVGFNSTIEQDIYRLNRLKELGISPFVQPYRDFNNDRKPTLYEKDIAQWANKHQIFKSCDFADFSPRKGFKCKYYLKQLE